MHHIYWIPSQRVSQGIFLKMLRYTFAQGIFELLKIKEYTRVAVGCGFNLLAFEANFDLGDNPIMEWGYSSRLHCICDCSSEGIISSVTICGWCSSRINVISWGIKNTGNKLRIQINHWENTQNFVLIAPWQPGETLARKKKAEQVKVLTKTWKGIEFYKQLTTIVTEFHCFPSY